MYLSKITLDPRHPMARRDLSDAYEMHRTLTRCFVGEGQASPARFLWRLEASAAWNGAVSILVQSGTPADCSPLMAMPGYAQEIQANKRIDLEALIQTEARYRFRLRVNPTVTRNGQRQGLLEEEEQMAWLSRQGARCGFSVLACIRGANEGMQVRQGNTGNRITVHTVLLDGLLQVTDAARVREASLSGLGHAKAFGLGLLSLARSA